LIAWARHSCSHCDGAVRTKLKRAARAPMNTHPEPKNLKQRMHVVLPAPFISLQRKSDHTDHETTPPRVHLHDGRPSVLRKLDVAENCEFLNISLFLKTKN
jgi:hypothetical protein